MDLLYNNPFVIRKRLEEVRARIVAAAKRVGRDPASVRLVGVTKGIAVDRLREAIACGVEDLGENRVQEAQAKILAIEQQVRWHFIGHLQRNKAKFAVQWFDVIHSVDSVELVEMLDREAAPHPALSPRRGEGKGEGLEVLIQVNISGEATKHGCPPGEVETLARTLLKSRHLKFTGLMTMAPFGENPEKSRPFFRQLRELRDRLQEEVVCSQLTTHDSRLHLSMGMSQDFEVAVEEGATMVRIGTAIFQEERVP